MLKKIFSSELPSRNNAGETIKPASVAGNKITILDNGQLLIKNTMILLKPSWNIVSFIGLHGLLSKVLY